MTLDGLLKKSSRVSQNAIQRKLRKNLFRLFLQQVNGQAGIQKPRESLKQIQESAFLQQILTITSSVTTTLHRMKNLQWNSRQKKNSSQELIFTCVISSWKILIPAMKTSLICTTSLQDGLKLLNLVQSLLVPTL